MHARSSKRNTSRATQFKPPRCAIAVVTAGWNCEPRPGARTRTRTWQSRPSQRRRPANNPRTRTRTRARKSTSCSRDTPSCVKFAKPTTKSITFAAPRRISIAATSSYSKSILKFTAPNTKRKPRKDPRRRRKHAKSAKPRRHKRRTWARACDAGTLTVPSSLTSVPIWWELSVVELKGLILVALNWYQYFNVCRYDQIHKILTDEHKNLAIVNNTTILKLVARTGNFYPISESNRLQCTLIAEYLLHPSVQKYH
jgi:hypothetical protein